MHKNKTPTVAHRIKNLSTDAGWCRNSDTEMVRRRRRLQRDGHGTVGPFARGLVQLLFAKVRTEDSAVACGSNDQSYRVHSLEEFHSQGHQARQLSYGPGQKRQSRLHHRFWFGKKNSEIHEPISTLPIGRTRIWRARQDMLRSTHTWEWNSREETTWSRWATCLCTLTGAHCHGKASKPRRSVRSTNESARRRWPQASKSCAKDFRWSLPTTWATVDRWGSTTGPTISTCDNSLEIFSIAKDSPTTTCSTGTT